MAINTNIDLFRQTLQLSAPNPNSGIQGARIGAELRRQKSQEAQSQQSLLQRQGEQKSFETRSQRDFSLRQRGEDRLQQGADNAQLALQTQRAQDAQAMIGLSQMQSMLSGTEDPIERIGILNDNSFLLANKNVGPVYKNIVEMVATEQSMREQGLDAQYRLGAQERLKNQALMYGVPLEKLKSEPNIATKLNFQSSADAWAKMLAGRGLTGESARVPAPVYEDTGLLNQADASRVLSELTFGNQRIKSLALHPNGTTSIFTENASVGTGQPAFTASQLAKYAVLHGKWKAAIAIGDQDEINAAQAMLIGWLDAIQGFGLKNKNPVVATPPVADVIVTPEMLEGGKPTEEPARQAVVAPVAPVVATPPVSEPRTIFGQGDGGDIQFTYETKTGWEVAAERELKRRRQEDRDRAERLRARKGTGRSIKWTPETKTGREVAAERTK